MEGCLRREPSLSSRKTVRSGRSSSRDLCPLPFPFSFLHWPEKRLQEQYLHLPRLLSLFRQSSSCLTMPMRPAISIMISRRSWVTAMCCSFLPPIGEPSNTDSARVATRYSGQKYWHVSQRSEAATAGRMHHRGSLHYSLSPIPMLWPSWW
ncbi:unknown [Prevotella sp. CAG:924]|nr:unknown [Prevotella sp. CAG:924]